MKLIERVGNTLTFRGPIALLAFPPFAALWLLAVAVTVITVGALFVADLIGRACCGAYALGRRDPSKPAVAEPDKPC